MSTKARVAVLPKANQPLKIVEVILPDPGPNEVVIKQFASGICHSQLHQIHRPRNNEEVLGHESSGVVVARGKNVTYVKEGDYVLVTWVPRRLSKAKRIPTAASVKLPDGTKVMSQDVFTWADYTIADELFVVKVSETSMDVAAIIGCAVMTGAGAVFNTAHVKKNESVAIFGVGGVGVSALAAAKIAGANPIIAIDIDEAKLEFARKFGATITLNALKEDPVKFIHEKTRRNDFFTIGMTPVSGADYVFDCIGKKETMEQILAAARYGAFGEDVGGTAVLVGIPQTKFELNAKELVITEKKYIGSIGGSCVPDRDFPVFLDLYKKGQLDLNAMVTQRFKLDEINEAVHVLEKGLIKGRAILEF